ncbi:hypothetical protein [Winogradskyella immobilis]|uniref:Uncharacterized protein n=1 Tax=Winogradskyella immobilis TaxID=2816852 RepID=A0ABS8EKB4_9FLAO|nr:hypothetical protein [Winogradskyella immobilis]MCC1483644.1 hypothetical protein [Winogradskyella immobilis]MCG0015738.1 hypothetical protein [Winogradskyella immobilis]
MYNISTFFKIDGQQPKLEFVDIKLSTDNLLFIDPRLIEISDSAVAKEMQLRIEAFWGELIKAVRAKNQFRVNQLLSGLSEPHETRLGYSFSKHSGNSVGEKLKPKIIDAIQRNKAVRTGVLSHFSDVELFIEDIGCDRISDITTKIIKEVLVEYTQKQCELLEIPMTEVWQNDMFDYRTYKWATKKVFLPVFADKPIIFVPKNLVRLENSANSNLNSFYRFAIRNFISNDTEMLEDISPTGKNGEIKLRDVKGKHPLNKESLTNWSIKFGKLLVDYKSEYLNDRLNPLSDSEIMEIVYGQGYSQAS